MLGDGRIVSLIARAKNVEATWLVKWHSSLHVMCTEGW
jgi:hypothetical protein